MQYIWSVCDVPLLILVGFKGLRLMVMVPDKIRILLRIFLVFSFIQPGEFLQVSVLDHPPRFLIRRPPLVTLRY